MGGMNLDVFVSETPLPMCFDLYTPFPYSLQEEGEGVVR